MGEKSKILIVIMNNYRTNMKNCKIITSEGQFHFLIFGIQYYILGRISRFRFYFPLEISPILFHNSLEFF